MSDSSHEYYFTETQEKYLALAPVFTGSMSVICSSTIIYVILQGRGKKLKRVYQRLILMLASSDVLFSISKLTSVAMVPASSDIWGSIGNTATCAVQGALKQIGMTAPLYNGALSLFYLMSVRYKMKEEKFAKRVEPYVHCVCIVIALLGSILGLSLTAFNEVGIGVLGCYYADYPFGCSSLGEGDVGECIRGQYAGELQFAFGFATIALLLIGIPLCQFLTYLSVREQSKRTNAIARRSTTSTTSFVETRRRTQQVANQALWYVGTFYITWIPAGALRVIELAGWMGNALFPCAMISQIFFPMQGVFLFFVYISPRYRFFREHNFTTGRDGEFVQRSRLSALYEAVTNEKSISFLRRTGRWKNRRSVGSTTCNGTAPTSIARVSTTTGKIVPCNVPISNKIHDSSPLSSCAYSAKSEEVSGLPPPDGDGVHITNKDATKSTTEAAMKQAMNEIMLSIDIDESTGKRSHAQASITMDDLLVEGETANNNGHPPDDVGIGKSVQSTTTKEVTFDDSIETLGEDNPFRKLNNLEREQNADESGIV